MFQDDLAERTLPPTERRRREARTRGEVARSPELTAAIILLAFYCLIRAWGFGFATTLATQMKSALTTPPPMSLSVESSGLLLQSALQTIVNVLWPIGLVVMICGVLANLIQTGLLWTPGILRPRIQLGDIVSGARLGEAIRQLFKLLALGVTLWWSLTSQDWQYRTMGIDDTMSMLVKPAENIGSACLALSFVLLAFAVLDYGLRFWHLQERLKMTFDERRAEQREDELDPRIKQRLRSGRQPNEIAAPARID